MRTKQSIAIIGATGNMGSSISKNLSKGNYRLLLCANDQSKLQGLAQDIRKTNSTADVEVLDCVVNASWEADIIIVAVPYKAEKEVAEKIREVANQKIVVSIANPLNESYSGLITAPDTSAAEELQKLLPNAKVVKAFNTIFAADFATPVNSEKQVDGFVVGNDLEAVQNVAELVNTAGFNPITIGDLSASRTLESMTLLLIQLTMKYNYNWLTGWKKTFTQLITKVKNMKTTKFKSITVTSIWILLLVVFQSCQHSDNSASYSKEQVDSLKNVALQLVASNESISKNLKTFDELDFDVFSNQKWDRLKESHAKDIKVFWPDGRLTQGIDEHIEDLKKLFVYAPDTRIKEHPIRFGSGKYTLVTGVFEGTFTKPMPIGNGKFIQPTGKAFKMPMATVGIWENGLIVEEHLFWDNQTYVTQLGLK